MVRIEVGSGCDTTRNQVSDLGTIDRIGLAALLENGASANFLCQMIEVFCDRLMQMGGERLTGAAQDERSVARIDPAQLLSRASL